MKKHSNSKGLGASAKKPSRVARVPLAKKPTAASRRLSTRSRKSELPTKEQRHLIYKKALEFFDARRRSICGIIDSAVREILDPPIYAPGITDNLPEVIAARKKSPNPDDAFWWPYDEGGFASRRRALLGMVKATAPALGIVAKPTKEDVRRTGAKRSGAKPGASRATPKSQ